MSSYSHLERAGIIEQEPLSFTVRTVTPDGISEVDRTETVEKFAGGGFYGSVVVLPESVIKTAQPEPFHEFLRTINWPTPFPSRFSESAAQLDQLSGEIFHTLIPRLTKDTITTPAARGYTFLDQGIGFGQVIERVRGRGPTFRDGGAENNKIRHARQQLWDLGVELGLEPAAQVHPVNPFGKPNLWLGEDGQVVWLDYLPAFRHTIKVRPFFRFPFHKDVQQVFNSSIPTYNRIHTERVRVALDSYRGLFCREDLQRLPELLELYDKIASRFDIQQDVEKRALFVSDGLVRGLISHEEADHLLESSLAYRSYRSRQLGGLILRAASEQIQNSPLKIFWDEKTQEKAKQFVKDSQYRREQVLGNTTLRGLKKARLHDLVSQDQYTQAISALPNDALRFYGRLQVAYFINSRFFDLVAIGLAVEAASSPNPAELAAKIAAVRLLGSRAVRAAMTVIAGRSKGKNLNRMALDSMIPLVGNYVAVPLQLQRDYGEKVGGELSHYNLRALAAAASSIRPGGGWGSDREEKIFNLGSRIRSRIWRVSMVGGAALGHVRL